MIDTKELRANYFIIPGIVLAVAYIGSLLTSYGVESGWYEVLQKPVWTPPGVVISIVWAVIYVLTAASAIIVWNTFPRDTHLRFILMFFVLNAVCNALWTAVFFGLNAIGWAVIEAAVLGITTLVLIVLLYPTSRRAALLLVPYAAWVGFATYLTFVIWTMNS